jgi:type IV secretory pathway VirB4 component
MNFEGIPPDEFDQEFIVEYFRREIEQAFSNARAGIFPNVETLAALAAQYKENAEYRRQADAQTLWKPGHTCTFGMTGAGKSMLLGDLLSELRSDSSHG